MTDQLVLMQKDGERLRVHPTTVKAHEAVGWKIVEQPTREESALKTPAEEKAEKTSAKDKG